MPWRLKLFAGALCILMVAVPVASVPQARHELGSVRTADDQPVSHAEVDLDGIDVGAATDKGAFSFDVPPFKVGFPYTFHVAGWVIYDPCVLARGRLYLPDPDAERVALRVVRPGDSRLLSANSIGCLVEEKASRFEPKKGQGPGPSSGLPSLRPAIFAQRTAPHALPWMVGGSGQVRLVQVAYPPNPLLAHSAPIQGPSHEDKGMTGDQSLGQQAKELGFTAQQLQSAINRWRTTVTDPYQKGLAALDAGRYADASDYISQSIKSGKGSLEEYVPLARAEYELGRYPAAESALRRVLAAHGDDPLILNNLGVVLAAEAKYSEAESLDQRALAINERALGREHPDVARDLNNLATLYSQQGKYAEAEPLYARALAIDEKALGPENPDTATFLYNLAALYHDQGKYAEAEPRFKQALAIHEKALGPESPIVARDLKHLAYLYHDQGKYAEAEPLFKQALAIDEKALGPDHPSVAIDLSNLATFYDDQGKYAEAEPLFQRALAIDKKALGSDHPDMAKALNNLARLYYHQRKYAEAEPLFKQALAIDEKALGPDSPDVAKALNNLGLLYNDQGKYAEAEPLLQRALASNEKALGPEHPDVATSCNNLGLLYLYQRKYAEAEILFNRALAIDEKALGPEHPSVAGDLSNLAALCTIQTNYAEAERLYKRALAIDERALGPEHPMVATIAENLALVLRKLGRESEAKVYEDQAASIRAKASQEPKSDKPKHN
jgi:tetratricopeptide (TPR) repeat protein